MTITWSLVEKDEAIEVSVLFEDIPVGIRLEDTPFICLRLGNVQIELVPADEKRSAGAAGLAKETAFLMRRN
jgi:hypothetical protein